MKTSSTLCARFARAYTLVEILVVIVIISVLAGFLVPQLINVIKDSNGLRTEANMHQITTGLASYVADYGRFPLDEPPASGEDAELLTDGSNSLVEALMGVPAEPGRENLNPRGTKFSEPNAAKNNRDGVLLSSRPYKLVDFWGKPLRVLLDTNGDHQVKNPDALNADPKISQPGGKPVGEFLPFEVAIYSTGKDGQPQTADDVVSWRK